MSDKPTRRGLFGIIAGAAVTAPLAAKAMVAEVPTLAPVIAQPFKDYVFLKGVSADGKRTIGATFRRSEVCSMGSSLTVSVVSSSAVHRNPMEGWDDDSRDDDEDFE